jgi:O-antigen/teichoic acid export membrane protein
LQSVRTRLATGTLWLGGARLVINLGSFAGTLILARILLPADFGVVALGTTMLAIINSLTNVSLSSALVQHKNPTIEHLNATWTLGFARGLALGALFAAAAYPAAAAFKEPRLANVMFVLAISVVLSGLANPRAVMLTKELIFWQQFMLQVSGRIVGLVVSIVAALTLRNYWALVIGAVAGQLAGAIISYSVLPFRPRLGWRHGRELFSFSMWLTFGQMINTLNWKFDHLLIGAFLGRPALGFYTVGDNLAVIPTREVTTPLTGTLFPAFARLNAEPKRLAAAYQSAQGVVTAVALPVGVGVALIADPLVRLTMGEKWLPSVMIIQALASVFALQTLGTLSQPLAMAAGQTRLLFNRDLQGFALRVPFILIGMYFWGLPGIIYARVLTGSIGIILHMQVVKQVTALTMWTQLAANARSLISVAAMAAAVFLAEMALPDAPGEWALIARIAVFVAVGAAAYIGVHALLWVFRGRPSGPETELLKILSGASKRLRSTLAREPAN